jgi:hypothetical protein
MEEDYDMHRIWKQKTLALLLIAVMVGGLLPGIFAEKVFAASYNHTLVGDGDPEYGFLKVDVMEGNIMLSRYTIVGQSLQFVPQYASNSDGSKSTAMLIIGNEKFVLGAGSPEWIQPDYPITPNSQEISNDNRTVTTKWVVRPEEAYVEIIQRVTLPSNSAQYIDVEWEINNREVDGITLSTPRFLRGIEEASSDTWGSWNEETYTVGRQTESQKMGIRGITPPSGHTSGPESDVRGQMNSGVLNNEIENFGHSEKAYAMQWDFESASFEPGATWTIHAREGFVDQLINMNGDGSDTTSGEPVIWNYTIINYGLNEFTFDYEIKVRDLSDNTWPEAVGWTVSPNVGSVTIEAREGVTPFSIPISFTVTPQTNAALGNYVVVVAYKLTSKETIGAVEESTISNNLELTMPSLNLPAPTNVNVQPGDRTVTVTWNAVDNANEYWVYQSTDSDEYGDRIATVTDSVYSVSGLNNGTTYYFSLKSVNVDTNQESSYSEKVSATPDAGSTSQPSNDVGSGVGIVAPVIDNSGVDVLVNGKVERAGTMTMSEKNGQTMSTIVVDPEKLAAKLAAEGQHTVVTIPVTTQSDVVVGVLDGEMVKSMEGKQAVLEIRTDKATYTLPAQQINIDAISAQIGKSVDLKDIKLHIEIAISSAATVQIVENAAAQGTFTIVLPPMDFKVTAVYGDTTVDVTTFDAYVERMIAIPEGIDPNRITTGVVVEPDGASRHVPTKVERIDSKYYAVINSLTNSTYFVVWHPIEFADVDKHWAKDAVNNMGSRMVVTGVGNGLYSPGEDITRAEFAAIIVRGLGLKPMHGSASFPDVSAKDWYSSAVTTAYSYDLISGFEDGTFRPNDKITREQAMSIIARAMEITGLKGKLPIQSTDEVLRRFTDRADASNWAQSSIVHNIQAGIVSGRSSTHLTPRAFITRAEVAMIVQKLLQKSDLI